jgi:hypothetical protein
MACEAESENECPICLESLKLDSFIVEPAQGCWHLFHYKCVVNLDTCPLCRGKMKPFKFPILYEWDSSDDTKTKTHVLEVVVGKQTDANNIVYVCRHDTFYNQSFRFCGICWNWTIMEFLEEVLPFETEYCPERIELQVKGKIIDKAKTLKDYDIGLNSVIDFIIRPKVPTKLFVGNC